VRGVRSASIRQKFTAVVGQEDLSVAAPPVLADVHDLFRSESLETAA
jgi:hypothetical protein